VRSWTRSNPRASRRQRCSRDGRRSLGLHDPASYRPE
jgi:hypothetical protein